LNSENSSNTFNNSNQNIFSKGYVAFDFEWSQGGCTSIFAAAFVDDQANSKVIQPATMKNIPLWMLSCITFDATMRCSIPAITVVAAAA
jgi:hypothetical protein